ncbi:ribonuclease H-like domain-containing protein [Tanacetum coccineum]
MVQCNMCRTPLDTKSKLGADGDHVSDSILYRSLADALQYLTFTRSDISYDVQQVFLYIHDPRKPHFSALKRILRYVRSTLDYDLVVLFVYYVSYCLLICGQASFPTTRSAEAEYRDIANAIEFFKMDQTILKSHVEKPEKFKGSDFRCWQQKMLFYLTSLHVSYVLTNSESRDPYLVDEENVPTET